MISPISIIVDSCCDLSDSLLARVGATVVPLTITIDGKDYIDDGSVDLPSFIRAMKASKAPTRSACPSPAMYMQKMLSMPGDCFVITLSSRLSGSFNAAVLGREMALEQQPNKHIHIFDSESASAGETYLALMVRALSSAGKSFEEIISLVEDKVRGMRTIFVLDSLDNLVKNGRMNKAVAAIANILSIRPILSDNGFGEIKLVSKARGSKNALSMMVDSIKKETAALAERSQQLTLSYCNCPERAQEVRKLIEDRCPAIGEVIMSHTSALSSMYAEDGGIVIAF